MIIVLGWVATSFILGLLGSSRKIGGTAIFFVSLIFSPLIGLIVLAFSQPVNPNKVVVEGINTSKADELKKLVELKDTGVLTLDEFEQQKQKLLNQ